MGCDGGKRGLYPQFFTSKKVRAIANKYQSGSLYLKILEKQEHASFWICRLKKTKGGIYEEEMKKGIIWLIKETHWKGDQGSKLAGRRLSALE